MFKLYNLESSQLLERAQFVDGKKASRAARLLSIKTGQKYQPRKVNQQDDSAWHNREQARFDSGEYIPLHEYTAKAVSTYEEKNNIKLFAHISKKNPSLIAYTKDSIKGAQDKQSLLSIPAFIELIAKDEDSVVKTFLTNIQNEHSNALAGDDFKLATTEDEIERVYTNYVESGGLGVSCMRYASHNFPRVNSRHYHPTRVYAAGDLAIAYQANNDGKTTARALCWPSKKLYSRVYATLDNDALHVALKKAGYTQSRYYDRSNPSLSGARLLRVENDDGNLVAPYLDEVGAVSDYGGHLEIQLDGDHCAQDTRGEIRLNDGCVCDCCGEQYNEEDMSAVYTDSRMNYSESWCEHCRGNNAFYCQGYNEYFIDSVDHSTVDDETYTQRYIDNNGASFCDYYEEFTFGDVSTVIVDADGEIQHWSENAVHNYTFEYDGNLYSKELGYILVVTARYDSHVKNMRFPAGSPRPFPTVAYYTDRIEKIPSYLIDDGEIEIVEGKDGRTYLRGYVDHYPVARERFDIDEESESLAA